jgi:hypothetical protein
MHQVFCNTLFSKLTQKLLRIFSKPSFGSGDSLLTAAQKCEGDSNAYPGSLSLRELIAILPYLFNILPPGNTLFQLKTFLWTLHSAFLFLAGDYILDTIYSSSGWVSLLDGSLYEISSDLSFFGFSPSQCLEGDFLVWSLPANYSRNKKNGTLKCSSNSDVLRNSFCLRYFKSNLFYSKCKHKLCSNFKIEVLFQKWIFEHMTIKMEVLVSQISKLG